MDKKAKLDQFALDIEFLLISVIQGTALATLASVSAPLVGDLQFQYFPYIFGSFFLILNFWSEAIIHAVSFIDWPLDLGHNFLYFAASFFEVMAFFNVDQPVKYFGFIVMFLLIAGVLFFYDLKMIKERKSHFTSEKDKALYTHILKRQLFEMKVFVPIALLYNGGVFIAMLVNPSLITWSPLFATIQALFALVVLMDSIRGFKKRAQLITESTSA